MRENNLSTVAEVTNYTKAGGACAACHEKIEDALERILKDMGKAPMLEKSDVPAPVTTAAVSAEKPKMTNIQRMRKIEEIIESVRPTLQRDHGDIEIVDIIGKNIYVNLKGACMGCALEAATLGGIQQKLFEELGEYVRLLPASLMEMGQQ